MIFQKKNKKIKKVILILISLFFISNINAKECKSNVYLKSNDFQHKSYKSMVYKERNGKYSGKLEIIKNFYNSFPKCTINNYYLFQYLWRNDMKNILLIQFIFKNVSDYDLKEFSKSFLQRKNIVKVIKKIVKRTNKKIIIEFKSAFGLEIGYEIKKNGDVKISYKNERNNYK